MCKIKFEETFINNVGLHDLSKKVIREKTYFVNDREG